MNTTVKEIKRNIANANTVEKLFSWERVNTRLYEIGEINAETFGELDVFIMERIAEIETK